MTKLWRKIKKNFKSALKIRKVKVNVVRQQAVLTAKIKEVDGLFVEYQKKIEYAEQIYTSVKGFNSQSGDKVFWPWVRSVLLSEEYRYLIFIMRENVIRELAQTSDANRMREINGQLKMLQILDAYLTKGLTQYDEQQKNKI